MLTTSDLLGQAFFVRPTCSKKASRTEHAQHWLGLNKLLELFFGVALWWFVELERRGPLILTKTPSCPCASQQRWFLNKSSTETSGNAQDERHGHGSECECDPPKNNLLEAVEKHHVSVED